MIRKIEKTCHYFDLGVMALRGLLFQLVRLQFRGVILMGKGASIQGLHNLELSGPIKIGVMAKIDAKFCRRFQLGKMFSLGDFSILRASGSTDFLVPGVRFGDHVTFGPYCNIGGGFGLAVGDNCVFGPYVSIHPEGHAFYDASQPIRQQGVVGRGITIGSDNWFGAKVTILDGVTIEGGSVFGAACLVSRKFHAANGVYVGSPAHWVRSRLER
jgi:acetyltransferase-like isoleucine patch superfamily enzyme